MTDDALDSRARIVSAATKLLEAGGRDAVSTRSVSAAAGVQAPTIYRQFGDMQGLLNTVAAETFAAYIRTKRVLESSDDALQDLRRGWDHHVAFGIDNAAAYQLIYSDPDSLAESPAKREGHALLKALIERVAQSGRLAVSVSHAQNMIYAACRGVTLSLIATPEPERDTQLSNSVREAIINAITTSETRTNDSPERMSAKRVQTRAIALRAVLADAPDALSGAERHLLGEWLDRLSSSGTTHSPQH